MQLDERRAGTRRRRAWWWLRLTLSILTTLYCFSGVVMNAHFSMTGSTARSAEHVLAAEIFLGLTLLGVLLTLRCVIQLWRTRPSRSAN